MLMQKGRIRRVVVYFRGLQTHTVDTKADTKQSKCHSLLSYNISVQGGPSELYYGN